MKCVRWISVLILIMTFFSVSAVKPLVSVHITGQKSTSQSRKCMYVAGYKYEKHRRLFDQGYDYKVAFLMPKGLLVTSCDGDSGHLKHGLKVVATNLNVLKPIGRAEVTYGYDGKMNQITAKFSNWNNGEKKAIVENAANMSSSQVTLDVGKVYSHIYYLDADQSNVDKASTLGTYWHPFDKMSQLEKVLAIDPKATIYVVNNSKPYLLTSSIKLSGTQQMTGVSYQDQKNQYQKATGSSRPQIEVAKGASISLNGNNILSGVQVLPQKNDANENSPSVAPILEIAGAGNNVMMQNVSVGEVTNAPMIGLQLSPSVGGANIKLQDSTIDAQQTGVLMKTNATQNFYPSLTLSGHTTINVVANQATRAVGIESKGGVRSVVNLSSAAQVSVSNTRSPQGAYGFVGEMALNLSGKVAVNAASGVINGFCLLGDSSLSLHSATSSVATKGACDGQQFKIVGCDNPNDSGAPCDNYQLYGIRLAPSVVENPTVTVKTENGAALCLQGKESQDHNANIFTQGILLQSSIPSINLGDVNNDWMNLYLPSKGDVDKVKTFVGAKGVLAPKQGDGYVCINNKPYGWDNKQLDSRYTCK